MPRCLLWTGILLLATASSAMAQSSDLQADSSSVSPAVAYEPYEVTVHMTNLGPDDYTAGTTKITVDIDDPTKPWISTSPLNGSACQDSVSVVFPTPNIPVGGSASFTFTQTFGPCGLAVVRIRSTVEVQGGFSDPNLQNNTDVTDHVFSVPLPVGNVWFVLLLGLGTASLGVWWLRRRRVPVRA